MLTMLVYFINGVILAFFAVKVYLSIRKKSNPYMGYFMGTAAFYSLSMLSYTFLISTAIITKDNIFLYWSDFIGRLFLYIGSLFAVQIALYHFLPKSNKRFLASIFLGVISFFLVIYNLLYPNYPYFDQYKIIHWQASPLLGAGLAFVFVCVWIPASYVFIREFIKSGFTSVKAFLLGSGFFLGSVSGLLQDFSVTTVQYLVVNLALALGFILIFFGLFYEEA
jgi:hypothetical protein